MNAKIDSSQTMLKEQQRLLRELEDCKLELEAQNQQLTEAHMALELSGKRYADLFDYAPIGYLVVDGEGVIRDANRSAQRMLGVGDEPVIGKLLIGCFSPYSTATLRTLLEQMAQWRIPQVREVESHGPDGVRHFRLDCRPNLEFADDAGGCRIAVEDITERKQTEEQLRIAAVAFESHYGIMVTDPQGKILQVNQSFTEITGYSDREAVGQKTSLLRSGRQSEAFYRRMWEAITREGRWEGEIWNRHKDGGVHLVWLAITAVRDPSHRITHFLGSFSDITEPREAEQKILELAFYDPLTHLPNRRLMCDRLEHALDVSNRSGHYGALLLVDLDRFKILNETRGHDIGDLLLMEAARRLRGILKPADTAARFGGDAFLVVLEELGEDETQAAAKAAAVVDKLREELGRPYDIRGCLCHLSASAGVALFAGRARPAEALLQYAELALYRAKDAGRDTARFYNPAMQAAVEARSELESGLRRALERNELRLLYQPQLDIGGRVLGAEVLLRWQKSEPTLTSPAGFLLGLAFGPQVTEVMGPTLVAPAEFMPVAEQTGLILPMGHWVLDSACRRLAEWAHDPATRNLQLAVNISARQFHQPDFVTQVRTALETTGANPSRLLLELTENVVQHDIERVVHIMNALRSLGIWFSLDDFGTGYSSLACLKRLPLDQLKIDCTFVQDLPDSQSARAIVRAIIGLGHSLSLQVIAEGVETEAQREFLANEGCLAYQGYLFGQPGPVEAFEALIYGEGGVQTDGRELDRLETLWNHRGE